MLCSGSPIVRRLSGGYAGRGGTKDDEISLVVDVQSALRSPIGVFFKYTRCFEVYILAWRPICRDAILPQV